MSGHAPWPGIIARRPDGGGVKPGATLFTRRQAILASGGSTGRSDTTDIMDNVSVLSA